MLPTPRILLGPGPSQADPRVLRAMATPLLGQFDPEFTAIMDEVMALSRLVFQTASARTFFALRARPRSLAAMSYDELLAEHFIIAGTPDEVADRFAHVQRELGIGHLLHSRFA